MLGPLCRCVTSALCAPHDGHAMTTPSIHFFPTPLCKACIYLLNQYIFNILLMTFLKPMNLHLHANQRWCQWCGKLRSYHGFDRHMKACEWNSHILKQHETACKAAQQALKSRRKAHLYAAAPTITEDVLITPGVQIHISQLILCSKIQLV